MTSAPSSDNRTDRIHALVASLTCRPPATEAEFSRIAALRYRAYRAAGMLARQRKRRLEDEYDRLPNAIVLGLWQDDTPVASVRLHLATRAGIPRSPALAIFPDALNPVLDAGLRLLDPNRLVVDPEAGRKEPDLHLALMRLPMIAAVCLRADVVTATVRHGHTAFYSRLLRMSEVAAPRPYPPLIDPLGLMTVDFKDKIAGVHARHPWLVPTADEIASFRADHH